MNNKSFDDIKSKTKVFFVGFMNKYYLFVSPSWCELILVRKNSNLIITKQIKKHVLNIKISEKGKYVLVCCTDFDESTNKIYFILLGPPKLNIICSITKEKLGFKNLPHHIPRNGFEISETLNMIIISNMAEIYFYDLNFKFLFKFKNIYPRTFSCSLDQVSEKWSEYIELLSQKFISDDLKISNIEIEKAKKIFDLKDYSIDNINTKFNKLIKKCHPDLNKDANANNDTIELLNSYKVLLNYAKMPNQSEFKLNISSNRIDWISFIAIIDNTLYLGGYSGRVVGLQLDLLFNTHNKKELIENNSLSFYKSLFAKSQNFYFVSSDTDLCVVFDIIKDNSNLIIKTSLNPFAKSYMKSTQLNRKVYSVSIVDYLGDQLYLLLNKDKKVN